MQKQILIVADDHVLRQRYAEALAAAAAPDGGAYQIVTVSTLTSAAWYAARRRFDMAMIDAQLRGPRTALTWLLVDRNPEGRVIEICASIPGAPRHLPQRSGFSMIAPNCTTAELRAIVDHCCHHRP